MSKTINCRYLTLAEVIDTSPLSARSILAAYVQSDQEEEVYDDNLRKLLVATIMQRVRSDDCQKNGWILYGFPQNRPQALCAQQSGLLPRQVFVLLPDQNAPPPQMTKKPSMIVNKDISGTGSSPSTQTPTTTTTKSNSNPSSNSQKTNPTPQIANKSGSIVPDGVQSQVQNPSANTVAASNVGGMQSQGQSFNTNASFMGGMQIQSQNLNPTSAAAVGRYGASDDGASYSASMSGESKSGIPSQAPFWMTSQHTNQIPFGGGSMKSGTAVSAVTKVTSVARVVLPDLSFKKVRDIADTYDYEICKVIPYEKWRHTKKTDIEAELLATMITVKPSGSPWIPRILVIGPPSSGKTTVAEALAAKYGLVNVDFIECVRGAARLKNDLANACQKYLRNLNPLNDANTKLLLQRRLLREDCERKGFILHGFPDTMRQLTLLESLDIIPNRVFYLACDEDQCWSRLSQKRQQVFENNRMEGVEDRVLQKVDEDNFEEFPYGKSAFRKRYDAFQDSFEQIAGFYGSKMIYVDATRRIGRVVQFMEQAVLKPPIIRFKENTDRN